MEREALFQAITAKFPEAVPQENPQFPELKIPREKFRALMEFLHDDPAMKMDYPMCQTAVDWPEEKKISTVNHLFSIQHRHKLAVKVDLDREKPSLPTVSDLWRGCEWFERETFEMYGVVFENHPDLRRLMLTDDWVGFPLRKDYKDSRIAGKPY